MNIEAVVAVKQLIINGDRHTTSDFDYSAGSSLYRAYIPILVKEGETGAPITGQRRRAPGTRDVT